MLRRLSVSVTATATICLLCSSLTLAANQKPKQPDKFPPNPLEITVPDPLLPRSPKDKKPKPLTPEERQRLEPALDELNQQAAAKFQAGEKLAAFEIWNRELRLRRFLGSLAEVEALSRVGAIAWTENERQQLFYITQRLQTIQKQIQSQKTVDLELLQALGQAYQQVRSPKQAVEVYNQVLATQKQQGDTAAEIETLKTLGELNLSWFDYPSAAAAYEQLLTWASSRGDLLNQLAYLQQLVYIYDQAKQPQNALKVRTQLAKVYQQTNNYIQLSELKLEIAEDYEALAEENPSLLQEAFSNYQVAYRTAWELQQYVGAAEALQKLINLYRSTGQMEEALQTSSILIQAQELANNSFGLMNAYDQIGQIYVQRQDYPQARTAFQKALEIAQQLNYDTAYLTEQLQKVAGKSSQ
ncbi:MAG: tetratricopeptide repeat protein [Scytonema sp. PMC 1069.18]|nr:tetratricopeptide repeat protein [Scytonema sp. PMC 1069.18]MEC4884513.1 tetratricopeptide repeat protein [Scytonema sp. PMC 1070.18]